MPPTKRKEKTLNCFYHFSNHPMSPLSRETLPNSCFNLLSPIPHLPLLLEVPCTWKACSYQAFTPKNCSSLQRPPVLIYLSRFRVDHSLHLNTFFTWLPGCHSLLVLPISVAIPSQSPLLISPHPPNLLTSACPKAQSFP